MYASNRNESISHYLYLFEREREKETQTGIRNDARQKLINVMSCVSQVGTVISNNNNQQKLMGVMGAGDDSMVALLSCMCVYS